MSKLIIKEICKRMGTTQIELARKLNIRPDSLSQSISRGNIGLERLEEIANILGVDITELFESGNNQDIIECPHCHKRFKIVPID